MAAILDAWRAERPGLDVSPVAIFGRVTRIERYQSAALREVWRRHQVHSGEYDVLAALSRSGPGHQLTPTELYRSVLVTSATMTERLDRLERRNLIRRRPPPATGGRSWSSSPRAAAPSSNTPTPTCWPPKPPCSKASPGMTAQPSPGSSPSSPPASNKPKTVPPAPNPSSPSTLEPAHALGVRQPPFTAAEPTAIVSRR